MSNNIICFISNSTTQVFPLAAENKTKGISDINPDSNFYLIIPFFAVQCFHFNKNDIVISLIIISNILSK